MPRSLINFVHTEVLAPYARALSTGGAPTEKMFESCMIPFEDVANSDRMITI